MSGTIRDNGNTGTALQVFVPHKRLFTDNIVVKHGNVVRFYGPTDLSAQDTLQQHGFYEFNDDGIKQPFYRGLTMGIPYGVTTVKMYLPTNDTVLKPQHVEVM